MRYRVVLACVVLTAALPVFGEQGQHDAGVWHTAAPAPMKRTEVAAATVAGKIYVVGGFEQPSLGNVLNFAITPAVEEYDPAVDRWITKASMPVGLHHVGIGVVGGRLYIIGGYKQSGLSVWGPVPTVYAYDPATDAWSERAPMPTARGALSVTVHDGKLYAIGGRSGPADFGAVDIYDPTLDRWTAGPPIEPRGTAGAVVYCGAIHVFGGESQARRASLGDVLRLTDGVWQPLAPMPTPRNFARAVVLHDAVYVVGGSPTPEASHASEGSAIVERFSGGCSRNTPH